MISAIEKQAKKGVSVQANLRRTFNQFLKRRLEDAGQKYEVIKEQWSEDRQRWAFVLQNSEGYFVEIRGEGLKVSALEKPLSFEEAELQFNRALEIRTKTHLQLIDSYYPQAKRFILKYQQDKGTGDYSLFQDLRKVQFILAVSELASEGFTIEAARGNPQKFSQGKASNKRPEYFEVKKQRNRYFTRLMNNFEIPVTGDIQHEFEYFLRNLVKDGPKKESTLITYYYQLLNSIEFTFSKFPGVYGIFAHKPSLVGLFSSYIDNEVILHSGNGAGSVLRSENHPMIPIQHLNKILDEAFDFNPSVFNFIILSLSTGLRPTEMRRLLGNVPKYLIRDDNYLDKLDYQNGLIGKTGRRVNPKVLKCPSISLISRVLLKYNHPMPDKEFVDQFFEAESTFRKDDLAKYTERSLRTTAGHHIIYCTKVRNQEHSASIFTVKDRMAHQDTSMATKVYAKDLPSDIIPETYFGCPGIEKNGELITAHFPLWDGYLLKKWLDKMLSIKQEQEVSIIWNQVLNEWAAIRKQNKPHEEALVPLKY